MSNRASLRVVVLTAMVLLVLAVLVAWPDIDLVVSGWFYRPGDGFFLRDQLVFSALHFLAHAGSRLLGLVLIIAIVLAFNQARPLMGLSEKAWVFLLLALLLGPGLVANTVFKEHWGRARPREVTEFGGSQHFSRALVPAHECRHNCSFVAGDPSFGFYLPAFAYVMAPPRSRRVFWAGIAAGCVFGLARLAEGAHFLSDVLFAALFTQLSIALLYIVMFGAAKARAHWRSWLFLRDKSMG